MKTWGIILIIFGGLSFIGFVIGLSKNPEQANFIVQQLFFDIGLIGLGIYLLNRANTKKKEQEEKEKWGKSSN